MGLAPGRATVTQLAPSQSPGASSAVCTSRHRTTQGSLNSTAPQRNAPPACCAARARATASGVTGDHSSALSPATPSPAPPELAPRRALSRGVDARIRRRTFRAARHRIRARHPADAVRNASGRQSPCALCRSPGPDSPMGTTAKCVWTGRVCRLSSASSVRRTGTEMACIGTATHRHRHEVCTPSRLGVRRERSAPAGMRGEQSGAEPLAVARCCWAGWVCLRKRIRTAAPTGLRTGEVCLRGRIRGAKLVRAGAGAGGYAGVTGGAMSRGKRQAITGGCADSQHMRGRLSRPHFTRDNGIYREQYSQDPHRARV